MEKLLQEKANHWYIPIILSIVFIVLGIWSIVTPIPIFLTIAMFFGIGILISGILETLYSIFNRKNLKNWGWNLAGGILTLFIGIQLVIKPQISLILLALYIGFWVLFRSIISITLSLELKKENDKRWGMILVFGLLGVILSFILIWNPILAGITIAYWIGFGLITLGIVNLILGINLKSLNNIR